MAESGEKWVCKDCKGSNIAFFEIYPNPLCEKELVGHCMDCCGWAECPDNDSK